MKNKADGQLLLNELIESIPELRKKSHEVEFDLGFDQMTLQIMNP